MTGTLRSINPVTGDEVASYPAFTAAEVDAALAAAHESQRAWRATSLGERTNFPFCQVTRFAAPALMAGNGGLLKHAPNLSGRALAFEAVLADPRIAAVTITGSDRAGGHVAAAAGRALKKSVLELGGSDQFLVLADADLAVVAVQAARSRFLNSGQSCLAAKRFVVEAPVADEFEGRLVDAVEALVVGNPLDPATQVGPLARADLVDGLDRQVRGSVARGARVLTGGRRIGDRGWFYAPTVLAGVRPGMPAYEEATFGPVAAVIRVPDEAHAVEVANDTAYGLGASVWTRDAERGLRVARQVQSGAVFVNAVVASDPRLPFGGIKRSGYGRELSAAGIREFTNLRTYWVRGSASATPGALTE